MPLTDAYSKQDYGLFSLLIVRPLKSLSKISLSLSSAGWFVPRLEQHQSATLHPIGGYSSGKSDSAQDPWYHSCYCLLVHQRNYVFAEGEKLEKDMTQGFTGICLVCACAGSFRQLSDTISFSDRFAPLKQSINFFAIIAQLFAQINPIRASWSS